MSSVYSNSSVVILFIKYHPLAMNILDIKVSGRFVKLPSWKWFNPVYINCFNNIIMLYVLTVGTISSCILMKPVLLFICGTSKDIWAWQHATHVCTLKFESSCVFSQDDDDDDCFLWLFSQDKVNDLLPASVSMQFLLKARSLALKKKASKKDWAGLEPVPLLSTVHHKIAFVFLCQTFATFLREMLLVDCKGFTIKCA